MNVVEHSATILEDARARDEALVELIKFTDQQALSLMQLYLGVLVATITAGLAGLASSELILKAFGWGAIAAAPGLAAGSVYCLRAMMPKTDIFLPGRGAEYWLWASDSAVSIEMAVTEYLKSAEQTLLVNREVNSSTAGALKRAKICGMIAAASTGLATAIAFLTLTLSEAAGAVAA